MTADNKATIENAYMAASNARSEEIIKLRSAERRLAELLIGYRMLLYIGSPIPESLDRLQLERHEYEQAIIVLLDTIEAEVDSTETRIAKLRPVVRRLMAAETGLFEARLGTS